MDRLFEQRRRVVLGPHTMRCCLEPAPLLILAPALPVYNLKYSHVTHLRQRP
jgi:hypothetical protein